MSHTSTVTKLGVAYFATRRRHLIMAADLAGGCVLTPAALAARTNGNFVQWAPPRAHGVTLSAKF